MLLDRELLGHESIRLVLRRRRSSGESWWSREGHGEGGIDEAHVLRLHLLHLLHLELLLLLLLKE